MKRINENDREVFSVKVGDVTISRYDDTTIWLERDSGEGMGIKESILWKELCRIYRENF